MGSESTRPETVRAGLLPHRWERVDSPGTEAVVASHETVIAGGGPAGLTAAYELTKHGRSCVVLESDPYRRLSYSWHAMTPELGEKFGWDEQFVATLAGEPRSKVTFDIEPVTQGVKLTVIHDGFEPGSTVVQMISVGWPDVISSLKTLLETGEPLPA